ncbi:MAG: PfkB family carbohydrate kinase [Thermoflexales bacterium]|nr:PfkB family carbohydrate kinase [Thermoflexales bacterium]
MQFDVLALGATAVDHLLYVERYPPPNVKVSVLRSARQCGGLAATALVAAARLGARCAYAGILGSDQASQFVRDALIREGIDLTHCLTRPNASPIQSTIIISEREHTRNIFTEHLARCGAADHWPPAALISAARVLHVDHVGMAGMLRAALIARASRVPIVSDVERDMPGAKTLLALVDHLITSWEFAATLTGASTIEQAVRALWSTQRALVAVTAGEEGVFYTTNGYVMHHQPAFRVRVVDTTGCGDVFRGAYCAALAWSLPAAQRIRLAAAAAALKATQRGAQAGAPTLQQVQSLIASQEITN